MDVSNPGVVVAAAQKLAAASSGSGGSSGSREGLGAQGEEAVRAGLKRALWLACDGQMGRQMAAELGPAGGGPRCLLCLSICLVCAWPRHISFVADTMRPPWGLRPHSHMYMRFSCHAYDLLQPGHCAGLVPWQPMRSRA